jgi:hypothetical protein
VTLLLVAVSSLRAGSAVNLPERPKAETEAARPIPEENESTALGGGHGRDGSDPAHDRKDPPPLKPSNEPRARGSRLAFVVGVDLLPWANYGYETRVNLPDGQQLQYSGRDGAPGVTLFAGGSFTLPRALRRITVGASIAAGGLNSQQRAVIPSGVSTLFSQRNLQNDLRNRYSFTPGWHSVFSPYIEHEVGSFGENRVRAGYQYWKQTGSYTGVFVPTDGSSALAAYNVRLKLSSHLVRVSVNQFLDLGSSDSDTNTPHRPRRQSGMIRQWGVMVGTHGTIMIFVGIGPFWDIGR